jgi:hypothetical protein
MMISYVNNNNNFLSSSRMTLFFFFFFLAVLERSRVKIDVVLSYSRMTLLDISLSKELLPLLGAYLNELNYY